MGGVKLAAAARIRGGQDNGPSFVLGFVSLGYAGWRRRRGGRDIRPVQHKTWARSSLMRLRLAFTDHAERRCDQSSGGAEARGGAGKIVADRSGDEPRVEDKIAKSRQGKIRAPAAEPIWAAPAGFCTAAATAALDLPPRARLPNQLTLGGEDAEPPRRTGKPVARSEHISREPTLRGKKLKLDKIYNHTMATGARRKVLGEGPDPRSKLYWLDIDVNFQEIFRQQRMIPSNIDVRNIHIRRAPSSLQYCVLHGAGTVANALSVGEKGTTFHSFEVDVAALVQTDESSLADRHRSARMIWNEVDVRSPQLEIYVQTKMLRHLVELYVTKRIDTVIMSMKIAVVLQTIVDTSPGSELLPVLDKDGRLYFRRTQCELLSVHASLASERAGRQL